jgi:RHS repeat-associated protein
MRRSALFRSLAASIVLGALQWTATLPVAAPARADSGQCRYEGGPGNPTYPSCLIQDCIGAGGLAQCTDPVAKASIPFSDPDTDADRFHYNTCGPNGITGYFFCQAVGGTFLGGYVGCTGLPSGFYGGSHLSTNSESLAIESADTVLSAWASAASCGSSSVSSDTGWFSNLGPSSCWGGGPRYTNGQLTAATRRRSYSFSNSACGGTTLEFLKHRQVVCPVAFAQRSKPNGDLHCYIPAECCIGTKLGNPTSVISGAKQQEEIDYTEPGGGGLQFRRFYNSGGYWRMPSSGGASVSTSMSDFWKFSYSRRLQVVSGNTELMGIIQLEDGTLRHYDGAGKEVLNREGGAETLIQISGGLWKRTLSNHEYDVYDSSGRLLSTTTRAGVVTSIFYDSSGRLAGVTNSFGQSLMIGYDTNGRMVTVTIPGGSAITYSYDSQDRIDLVTYPDNTTRRYHYEAVANGLLLTGITDEAGVRYATYAYDSSGRVESAEHAGGVDRQTFSYGSASSSGTNTGSQDAFGNQEGVVTGVFGGVFRKVYDFRSSAGSDSPDQYFDYDAAGNISRRRQFPGSTGIRAEATYSYDLTRNLETSRTEGRTSNGTTTSTRTITTQWHPVFRQPTQVSVYSGGVAAGIPLKVTSYAYDASGNVLTRTVTDTAAVPNVSRTWTYTYNGYGQVLTENGPRTDVNDVTTYTYYTCATGFQCGQLNTVTNAMGQVTTFNSYNAHGQPTQITDANGVVTTLAYDLRQRVTARCVNGLLPACAGGELTAMEYWPTGLLKKVTLPGGEYTSYGYDAAHRLVSVADNLGNRVEYTLDAMGNRTAENAFDQSNTLRRTHTRVFNTLNQLHKEINAAGTAAVTTTFGYDNNGNQTTVAAPLGRNSTNLHDELNRLKQITDPALGNTTFAYDAQDNLTSVTDPEGLITSYAYNGFGEVVQETSPDRGVTQYTYDPAGNLATRVDARGAAGTATYSYDALNRPTQIQYSDHAVTYTYDSCPFGIGRVCVTTDRIGTTSFEYDAHGRVTRKSRSTPRQGGWGTLVRSVGYAYTNGRLTQMEYMPLHPINYTYDAAGRISGIDGILYNVLYEPTGEVRGWTWANGSIAVRHHDLDGRVSIVDSAGGSDYAYDDANRLLSITATTGSSVPSWTYAYDNLDRLTGATRGSLAQGFTYDRNGNRKTQTGTPTGNYAYAYSGGTALQSNRLKGVSGGTSRNYQYDAMGNVLGDGLNIFTYDGAGRMATANGVKYYYDAQGQRTFKDFESMFDVSYQYDEAGHLLERCNAWYGADCTNWDYQQYVWLGDIPVAVRLQSVWVNDEGYISYTYAEMFNIHTDHLNTPRRLTRSQDATNAVQWRWDSDAFGVGFENGNAANDPYLQPYAVDLRFPGQLWDAETWRHYNMFRDYDPYTGRYGESDPIGLMGGINSYSYVEGNPISAIDVSGLCWSNARAVGHFYSGGGQSVSAGQIGCTSQIDGRVSPQRNIWKARVESAAKSKALSMQCGTSTTMSLSRAVGVASGVFWIGGFSLVQNASCGIRTRCSSSTREACTPGMYWFDCSLTSRMRDRFEHPSDFDNSANTSSPNFWDRWNYGGKPFDVTGSWADSVSGEGLLP